MGYIGAIIAGVGQTINLIGQATSHPSYPDIPKLNKINIPKATATMGAYEAKRMQASIDAWKDRFPELYKGGQYEVSDIQKQQQGMLGGNIASDMARSGLGPVREGDQYQLSQDIGLNPLTLSQRTSQAVTRQIAANPEWTQKITGGTLATLLANNYQNQMAYGMFKSANQTAQYVAGKQAGMYNTQALLSGLVGGAQIGASIYNSNYGPLSAAGQGAYVPAGTTNAPYSPAPSYPSYPSYPQQQAPLPAVSGTGPWSGGYQYGNFYDWASNPTAAPTPIYNSSYDTQYQYPAGPIGP